MIDAEGIRSRIESASWPGVTLVEHRGETLFSGAFGLANRADGIQNTLDTRFGTASGTKTFTAVAVARLVEQGAFSFSTRMSECLEVWPDGFDPGVTVEHLLTHTSGVPDYFDEETDDDFEALWTDFPMYAIRRPSDLLPMFADRPMKFAPGDRFSYANSGFVLLGLLVEQHTDKPYSDLVQSEVFDRSGMDDSGFFSLDRLPPRTAIGYLTDEDPTEPRHNGYTIPIVGQPDGGAFVTAPDMAAFWRALREGDLLGSEVSAALLTPRVPTGPGESYGLGMWIAERGDRLVHRMEGVDPGVRFVSACDLAGEVSVTIATNSDHGVFALCEEILDQAVS